jgi:TPR repeat protein/signal transduction histidine kinase
MQTGVFSARFTRIYAAANTQIAPVNKQRHATISVKAMSKQRENAKMTNKNKAQQICDAFFAEPINKLHQKLAADEYPALIENLKALAAKDHAGATRVLAILHLRGRGVPKSKELGLEWLHRSAELDDIGAQFHLALRYDNGWSVPKDQVVAFLWYLKAAENAHLPAQTIVGYRFLMGEGVAESAEQAVHWFRIAADRGDAFSQYLIGSCYKGGTALPQSDEEALHWFLLAAEQGDDSAQLEVANFYAEGKVVPQCDEEAARWLLLAAEQGNVDAQVELIECYALGRGVKKSVERVIYWLTIAAEGGRFESQLMLGMCYLIGNIPDIARIDAEPVERQGTDILRTFAAFWGKFFALVDEKLEKYGESNFNKFLLRYDLRKILIGLSDEELLEQILPEWESLTLNFLLQGVVVEPPPNSTLQSDEKARLWFFRAADQGIEEAKKLLSLLDRIENNESERRAGDSDNELEWAYEWTSGEPWSVMTIHNSPTKIPLACQEAGVRVLKQAAESGHINAQFALGELYDSGEWLPQSTQDSFNWYLRAAEQGHPQATLYVVRDESFSHQDQEKAFHLLRQADHPGSFQPEIKKALGDLYLSTQSYDLALESYLAGSVFDSAAALLIEEFSLVSHPDNAKALELLKGASGVGDLIAGLLPNAPDASQRLRKAVELLYPLVKKNREIPLPKIPKLRDWIVSRLAELETPPLPEQQRIAPLANRPPFLAQVSTTDAYSRGASELANKLAKFSIKVNPYRNVMASLLLAYLESGKERTKAEAHLKLAYKNKDAVATFLLHDFYPPASEDRQILLNSVLGGEISEHVFPEKMAKHVFALKTDGYSPEFLGRLLNDAQQARNEIHLYREAETQRKLAQAEQEKREAIENMMAMFAHKFRGPVDSILFNTAHQHDERVYVDAARTMNGLLDIFSVVSTHPDKLLGNLKDDTSGEGSPSGVLLHAIKLALVQLLSLRNRRRMSPHYLAYAKKQGKAPQELRLSAWLQEKSWQDLEESLQTRWELEVGAMIVTSSLDVVNDWMKTHLLPIRADGFMESKTQFAQYGPKASLLTVIFTEVLVNAIKHAAPAALEPIALSWIEGGEETIFSCVNPSSRESRTREASKGSGRGHKFLSLIADHLRGRFDADVFRDVSRVSMTLPSSAMTGDAN